MAIAIRASVLDNQNAFWSMNLAVQPSRTSPGFSLLSCLLACFFTFFLIDLSEAKNNQHQKGFDAMLGQSREKLEISELS